MPYIYNLKYFPFSDFGYLYMFGSNKFGQLGLGDFKPRKSISRVGGVLAGQKVEQLACGDGFTVVATNENQIYSWGSGESGRLGGAFTEQASGPKAMCTALPRPIFGTLHIVSCMSCRHWNTLIIAEKVLNQKTLKSRASSQKMLFQGAAGSYDSIPEYHQQVSNCSADSSNDFVLQDNIICHDIQNDDSADVFTSPQSHPSSASPSMESSVPTWLAEELNNAEYIPIPASLPEVCNSVILPQVLENHQTPRKNENTCINFDSTANLQEPSETVKMLEIKLEKLEKENIELKRKISEQSDIIKEQTDLINKLRLQQC